MNRHIGGGIGRGSGNIATIFMLFSLKIIIPILSVIIVVSFIAISTGMLCPKEITKIIFTECTVEDCNTRCDDKQKECLENADDKYLKCGITQQCKTDITANNNQCKTDTGTCKKECPTYVKKCDKSEKATMSIMKSIKQYFFYIINQIFNLFKHIVSEIFKDHKFGEFKEPHCGWVTSPNGSVEQDFLRKS
jgi:hypothetical protein